MKTSNYASTGNNAMIKIIPRFSNLKFVLFVSLNPRRCRCKIDCSSVMNIIGLLFVSVDQMKFKNKIVQFVIVKTLKERICYGYKTENRFQKKIEGKNKCYRCC